MSKIFIILEYMKKVIFVADFFVEDTIGGAELHDDVVLNHFKSIGILHSKIRCQDISKEFKKFCLEVLINLPDSSDLSEKASACTTKSSDPHSFDK